MSALKADCGESLSKLIADDLSHVGFLSRHYGIHGLGPVVKPATEVEVKLVEAFWFIKKWKLGSEVSRAELLLMAERLSMKEDRVLQALASYVSGYSQPASSEYPVGIVAVTETGSLIFGVNFELSGAPLGQTIHGEQFVIARAHALGRQIKKIVLNAPPCGHCRQFINETVGANHLRLNFPGAVSNLPFPLLLPLAFGPQNLGIESGALLGDGFQDLQYVAFPDERRQSLEAALYAANRSYAPYTQAYAGTAFETESGETFYGSYLENVAFNPSVSPLSAALVNFYAEKAQWSRSPAEKRGSFHKALESVTKVILAERSRVALYSEAEKSRPHFFEPTRQVVRSLFPDAEIRGYGIHQ